MQTTNIPNEFTCGMWRGRYDEQTQLVSECCGGHDIEVHYLHKSNDWAALAHRSLL